MKTYRKQVDINPFNSIVSILLLVFVFVALYFVARSLFSILSWIAPVLLIITLIMDYKVVVNYFKWIIKMLKENTLVGIGAIVLTVIGYPVIAGFLFGKALLKRKIRSIEKQQEEQKGEFIDYEEVKSEQIELPPLKPKEKQSEYDQLFDDDI